MLELSWFVCGILYFLLYNYLFNKFIIGLKFKITKKVLIFALLIGAIYFIISKSPIIYLRPFIIHLYFMITFKIIYKESFFKCLIGVFGILFLMLCSELIYDFFIVFILKMNIQQINEYILGYFFSNIVIFIICLIISNIKYINKFLKNIVKWYNKTSDSKILAFLFVMFVAIVTFILYNNFIKILPTSLLMMTNIFCVGIFTFIVAYFREKMNSNRVIFEYEQLLNYVKVYEKTIEEKSKNQHEYKNQLILIKGMLNKNNKKASNYIDDIICNQSSDDNLELLRKLQYLPQGGLKGLIYYKVEEMISNGIDVYIDISPKLNKPKVTKIINENLHDLSKIIGVYLDNAIDAVRNVENKYIVIEANIEKNNIIFSFSNTYNGYIDLSRLDKEGYTTKGQGKGYGLSLVKDIINNNETFEQSRGINGPYYIQKLYIKK